MVNETSITFDPYGVVVGFLNSAKALTLCLTSTERKAHLSPPPIAMGLNFILSLGSLCRPKTKELLIILAMLLGMSLLAIL